MIPTGMTTEGAYNYITGQNSDQDVYKIALYGEDAVITLDTPAYTASGEVSGQGYRPGGQILGGLKASRVKGGKAYLSWYDPIVWDPATIRAAGAMIYNASKNNVSVAVFGFGGVITSTNGPFRIPVPADSLDQAMICIN